MTIRKSSNTGIPFGDTAGRPANATTGQLYSNGEVARLELYTENGWQNIVQETPSVISISGSYLQSNSSNTITITGTNYVTGALAYAVGTNDIEYQAASTTVTTGQEITASFSNLSPLYEPYGIKVVNPSNLYGYLPAALYVNDSPIWSTASGSLGSITGAGSVSLSLSSSDPESQTLTYSVTSGSLPPGLSLNTSTGAITGTVEETLTTTVYSFTISASDGNNTIPRAFSYTLAAVPAPTSVELLVVAGGGVGASGHGGGGGAGGFRTSSNHSITAGSPITTTVGAGGTGANYGAAAGTNGSNSVFGSVTSTGGGRGGGQNSPNVLANSSERNGTSGGSGGGGGNTTVGAGSGGSGNAGGYTPVEGYSGANSNFSSATWGAAGGGGAGGSGSGQGSSNSGGNGGAGATSSITGTSTFYASGGGGGGGDNNGSSGGTASSGGGTNGREGGGFLTASGSVNTGGGSGGSRDGSTGNGGSGIVVIAYDSSKKDPTISVGLSYTKDTTSRSGYKIFKFTSGTGTVTF
jgi:hypothetical protein